MKDVHVDVLYKSMQLNLKDSSPIVYNKILCETMGIDFKNSPKMEFCYLKLKFGIIDWDCVRIQ